MYVHNERTLYLPARTYGFGMDNIRNESFLDVRVCTCNTYKGRKEGIGFYVAFNSLGHIAT